MLRFASSRSRYFQVLHCKVSRRLFSSRNWNSNENSFSDEQYRAQLAQEVQANKQRRQHEMELMKNSAAMFERNAAQNNSYQHHTPASNATKTDHTYHTSLNPNQKSVFIAGDGKSTANKGKERGTTEIAHDEFYDEAGKPRSKTYSGHNKHMRRSYGAPKTSQLHRYNKTLSLEEEEARRIQEVAGQYEHFPRYREILAMDVKFQMEEDIQSGIKTYPRQPMPKMNIPHFEEFQDITPPLARTHPNIYKATFTGKDPIIAARQRQQQQQGIDVEPNVLGLGGQLKSANSNEMYQYSIRPNRMGHEYPRMAPGDQPVPGHNITGGNKDGINAKNGAPEPKSMEELMNKYHRVSLTDQFRLGRGEKL